MRELRLHLSWVRGGDVTHWTGEQIGRKIVDTHHKEKVSSFLISEIKRREWKHDVKSGSGFTNVNKCCVCSNVQM